MIAPVAADRKAAGALLAHYANGDFVGFCEILGGAAEDKRGYNVIVALAGLIFEIHPQLWEPEQRAILDMYIQMAAYDALDEPPPPDETMSGAE